MAIPDEVTHRYDPAYRCVPEHRSFPEALRVPDLLRVSHRPSLKAKDTELQKADCQEYCELQGLTISKVYGDHQTRSQIGLASLEPMCDGRPTALRLPGVLGAPSLQ